MINYLQLLNTQQEKDKFVTLYEMYSQPLYRAAFEMMKDHAASEDVVHETFLTLIDNMDKVMDREPMKNWNYLVTILRHRCIDVLRRQKKTMLHNMEGENTWNVSEENIEAEFIGKEMTEVVKNLIEQMEYPYKQMVLLQYYNKMKGRDIAETLHLKPENVRQIAKRAREQLKKQLKELGYM